MVEIQTKKEDVIWNYIGTIVSMSSGFLLLPLLLRFLTDEELGLWYVYLAVSNLTQLFEFGFNPTFARNIVYCLSGSTSLSKRGSSKVSKSGDVNWHLLKSLLLASKIIYAFIALIAFILVATIGTMYIETVTAGMNDLNQWLSWGVFCLSIVLNLYFLYSITFLRGSGDIAGENKAKTCARLTQIILSAILLVCGFGLLGASIGFFFNGVVLRVLAGKYFKDNKEIEIGLKTDSSTVGKEEIKAVFSEISSISWRDGIVQIALYLSTQATSLISSLCLGLAETGMYSVLLQLSTAVYNFSGAFMRTYYPNFQSAFAKRDISRMRAIVSEGVTVYWLLCIICTCGIIVVVFPILPLFKPGIELSVPFFIFLTLYLTLLNHHSIFCNLIIGMNEIPYMPAYLISAALGTALSVLLCGVLDLGAWGMVLGQFIPQLAYNNWRWPSYIMKKLQIRYLDVLKRGSIALINRVKKH